MAHQVWMLGVYQLGFTMIRRLNRPKLTVVHYPESFRLQSQLIRKSQTFGLVVRTHRLCHLQVAIPN